MDFKDYYSTLGVAKTASEKEIKQAYRKLARKHHPDVNPGDKAAESRFKEINEAYEVLGDPAKRKKYDELGANWRMYEQAGAGQDAGGGFPGGGAWNVHFGGQGSQGGQGGFRTMTEDEMREMFGDADPFSDFFHTFFGGGGAQAGDLYLRIRMAPHPEFERKGRDLYTRVSIPLTTAVLGGEVDVKTLGGKSLRLKIPPTTQNGQVFRLKGHGMPAVGKSGETGDLYATVEAQLPKTLTPEQKKHFDELRKLETGEQTPAS